MALKSNFEDADFIASPFVDEVANPGSVPEGRKSGRQQGRELQEALNSGRAEATQHGVTSRPPGNDPATRDELRDSRERSADRRHEAHFSGDRGSRLKRLAEANTNRMSTGLKRKVNP